MTGRGNSSSPPDKGELEGVQQVNKTRWLHDGVTSGIAGYGNPIGVPNLTGDVYYDESYSENCLVNVVTLGVLREDEIIHSRAPKNSAGYDLILVGKPTDNSGFGGASFASIDLDTEKKGQNKGAVQEPNAFLKRHLLKSTYALFKILKERKLMDKIGFKDLGAGGVHALLSHHSPALAQSHHHGKALNLELQPQCVLARGTVGRVFCQPADGSQQQVLQT